MIVSFIKPCKGNKSIILKVKQNRSGEGAVWSGPAWEGGRVGVGWRAVIGESSKKYIKASKF